jgi:predicted Zn-dependent peptidase
VATVTSGILSSGRTSRFYKDLVRDKQLAMSVTAGSGPGTRYANLFVINGAPRYPHTNDELAKAVLEHLDRLKTEPVPERELRKIKNNLEANYIRMMSSNFGSAMTLLRYQLFYGDWKVYLKLKDLYAAVTAEDVMRFAKTYFTAENRTEAYLVKKAS